jgi:hypothetical protein
MVTKKNPSSQGSTLMIRPPKLVLKEDGPNSAETESGVVITISNTKLARNKAIFLIPLSISHKTRYNLG